MADAADPAPKRRTRGGGRSGRGGVWSLAHVDAPAHVDDPASDQHNDAVARSAPRRG